jgi:speckle-type POZ protein
MAASQAPVAVSTASRCATATAHGRHSFEIASYSALRGLRQGEFIRSASFSVGGGDWCINYLPNGNTVDSDDDEFDYSSDYSYYSDDSDREHERRLDLDEEEEENREYISLYLEHMSRDTAATVVFDIRVVNPVTGLSSPERSYSFVFNRRHTSWGSTRFIKRSELEASYVGDDRLVIECGVIVIFEGAQLVSQPKTDWEIVRVPPSDMVENLAELLQSGKRSDVTFSVKGEVFHAHKFVLAMRSPVFEAELYGPMTMRDKSRPSTAVEDMEERPSITVENMEPHAFKALLQFIYTDSLPAIEDPDLLDNQDLVKNLLVAADRYAMERMKLMCESSLCKRLDINNVVTILAIADQHHCDNLKNACFGYISSLNRMDDVVASKGYENLKRTCPSVVIDLWERAAKSRRI